MKKIIFLATYVLFNVAQIVAQPGSLDSSFNKDGLLKTKLGPNGGSFARSVAINNNGKIVIAGATSSADGFGLIFGLEQLNINGSLDKTFGNQGKVVTDFNGLYTGILSVVIQINGMIVAAGTSNAGSIIARYKVSGDLDSNFGINGKLISDFGGPNEGTYSLALQTDGKILAAGVVNGHFATARYKQNGSRDSTFGTNGLVETIIGNNNTGVARAVSIQADGKIVVAGAILDKHGAYDAVVVRYKKNGQLDNGFGNGGIVITDLGTSNDYYTSLVIQADGKINVAGYTGNTFDLYFVLAQYNKNGTLNSSFGTNGITTTDFANTDDKANGLALQSDGKIVVLGSTQFHQTPQYVKFALARYKSNGSLDSSFGINGKVTTSFGGNATDQGFGITIQSDGKILATGVSGPFAAVARYNTDSSNLHFSYIHSPSVQQTSKATTVSLSPNVVNDILRLQGMSLNKKTISVVSENGSAVLQNISTVNSKYSINTAHLLPGVYFVRITEGEQTTTLKFVKQ